MISPIVTERDIRAVARQMRSFWIGRADRVAELETLMADWVGAKYGVAFASGTAALAVAMRSFHYKTIDFPVGVCDAIPAAARVAGCARGGGPLVSIYPDKRGAIVDFARHLPARGEFKMQSQHRFGVFSFGALKDVSGGLGGMVVSNTPIQADDMKRISPLCDLNAAMILSQLARYRGKAEKRLVAGGKTWSLEA